MLPSSRTPEGEPLRCPICGASHNVDVSRPPGDSVCPCCGTLAWFPERVAYTEETRIRIRTYTQDLISKSRINAPLNQMGDFLVLGLTRCLAAYGTILWVESRRKWWSRHPVLNAIAYNGEMDSPGFAQEVFVAKQEIVRQANIAGRKTLLIGVPVIRGNRVLGIIEVLQRAESPVDAQRGYLHFVRHIANVVAGSAELP